MKIKINIFIIIISTILTSCVSPVKRISQTAAKIDKKEQIVQSKAKILIAAGQKLLERGDTKNGMAAIKKGESLLNVTIDEGSEILESTNIESDINKIYDEGRSLKEDIQFLEEKKEQETAKLEYNQIGDDAVKKYKFWLSMKIYGFILTIITAIGIYFYFKPTAFIGNAFGAITSFFKK